MRLLPSQQNSAVESAIARFKEVGEIGIYEPCNCGSMIRHNNGGNYHEIYEGRKDSDRYFQKFDTTCDMDAPAEWEETDEQEIISEIKKRADWL